MAVGLDDSRAVTSTSKSQLFHYFHAGKADLLLAVARHEVAQVLADHEPHLTDDVGEAAGVAVDRRGAPRPGRGPSGERDP